MPRPHGRRACRPPPGPTAAAGSLPRRTADKIASLALALTLEKKVCRARGGADRGCDAVDDLTPVGIGSVGECPAVSIPGGSACAADVDTLADLVACVTCVAERRATAPTP